MVAIEAQISTEQLLQVVERLPPEELTRLLNHVLVLRAQHVAPTLSPDETALLTRINATLPPELRSRYEQLICVREEEMITPEQLTELATLTQQVEAHDAQRLEALVALATLRQVPLPTLMDSRR